MEKTLKNYRRRREYRRNKIVTDGKLREQVEQRVFFKMEEERQQQMQHQRQLTETRLTTAMTQRPSSYLNCRLGLDSPSTRLQRNPSAVNCSWAVRLSIRVGCR